MSGVDSKVQMFNQLQKSKKVKMLTTTKATLA